MNISIRLIAGAAVLAAALLYRRVRRISREVRAVKVMVCAERILRRAEQLHGDDGRPGLADERPRHGLRLIKGGAAVGLLTGGAAVALRHHAASSAGSGLIAAAALAASLMTVQPDRGGEDTVPLPAPTIAPSAAAPGRAPDPGRTRRVAHGQRPGPSAAAGGGGDGRPFPPRHGPRAARMPRGRLPRSPRWSRRHRPAGRRPPLRRPRPAWTSTPR